MKVLLLSRYGDKGASSRVRSFQYLPFLHQQGISVTVSSLFSNDYLSALYSGQSKWKEVIFAYLRRLLKICTVGQYDLIIIEKELFPFIPAFFEKLLSILGIRYVADYDDALFHRYDSHNSKVIRYFLGRKIDAVMRKAEVVIAGNHYLAERAEKAGAKKIVIIPTVVNTEHYLPAQRSLNEGRIIIGWIGTPKTSHYLIPLLTIFERLSKQCKVKFVAIWANKNDFLNSPVEVWPWSEKTEVSSIQKLDIGIMPLNDSAWERGKCGYKLIQYMACGLPVVASPVGVNNEIVKDGVNGFLATTTEDWSEALLQLIASEKLRTDMGGKARELIENQYSLQSQYERLLQTIKSAAK